MTMEKGIAILLLCILFPLYLQEQKLGCNEAVCASIVSKCMLTQSCKCDSKNTTCRRDCFRCLDYLYSECCMCVDQCSKPNLTDIELGQKSHVEEFVESAPELFTALTEEKDRLSRWTSYTFPSVVSIFNAVQDTEIKFSTVPLDNNGVPIEEQLLNCTVAFLSQCMSFGKCRDSCLSMGAASCRWFHDGCCECVGSTCLNYGINEGRCLECPPKETDDEDETVVVVPDQSTEIKPEHKKEEIPEEKQLSTKETETEKDDEGLQKVDS